MRFPPLAAAYLAAAAAEQGWEVKFFDSIALNASRDQLASQILSFDPDVSAFIMNASSTADSSIKLARELKRQGGIIAAGGHHATFTYPSLLKRGFDVIFLGEGERTFGEFLRRMKEGDEWRSIRGIAYRDEEKVASTGMPDPVIRLDELPMPMFEVYDRERYKMGLLDAEGSTVTVETSRGCPYNCEYCSVTKMWGATWRFKSPKRVLEELKKVKDLGYKWVFFVDDNFIVPVKSFIQEKVEMLQEIIKSGLNSLRYIVQVRADFVARNEWLPPLLYEAGVRIAFLGIESGNPETLKHMRKNLNLNESAKAVQLLSQNGIIVHGGFILGAPYEDLKSMKRTVKFATSLLDYGLDSAQFSIYTPLPGTDAFKRAVTENSLLTLDWSLYDVLHPVMRTKVSPARVFLEQKLAHYRFFFIKGVKSFKSGSLFSKPVTEKQKMLSNGTKFIAKRTPLYLLGLLKLPFSALLLSLRLRKGIGEREAEELKEILEAQRSIELEWSKERMKVLLKPS